MLTDPPLVLDTDLVSSFAWIDRMDILETLFPQQMIILDEVLSELQRVEHLYAKVKNCINSGTMGSNNLSDVKTFCEANGKDLITTAIIIHYAVETSVIRRTEAETIWDSMLKKRRKLPAGSYSAYVEFTTQ